MWECAAAAVFLLVVSLAGVLDARSRVIPNWLTLPLFVLGVARGIERGDVPGAAFGLLVGSAAGLIGYASGGHGGGDFKLMAAIGPWLGFGIVPVFVVSALVGVVYAAAVFGREAFVRIREVTEGAQLSFLYGAREAWKTWEGKPPLEVPYGTCVAAASWICTLFLGVRV